MNQMTWPLIGSLSSKNGECRKSDSRSVNSALIRDRIHRGLRRPEGGSHIHARLVAPHIPVSQFEKLWFPLSWLRKLETATCRSSVRQFQPGLS